uniref:Uncharacterized protein n=1 Tax=Setaria italica TaxID=4555 RepID=K3Y2Y5_SETIT
MWPENIGNKHRKQVKMENFGEDRDPLNKDVKFDDKPVSVDFQRLIELTDSEKGQSHLQCLVKHWEYKRGSSIQVLEEELDLLCQQRKEIEQRIVQKRQQILERRRIHDESCDTVKGRLPHKLYAECDIISFWKERVMQLEEKLQACLQRESSLVEKPEGGTRNPLSRTQMDELSGLLKRADFFLHLILQSALIVIAHQDSDLRYRFIFNHYPTLADEVI